MGTIIGSKVREDGKIVFEVCVEQEEARQLNGDVDNIYIVSCGNNQVDTSVAQRGKNEATMYFLVPKNAREELKSATSAKFQKIKVSGKTLYVYTVKNE